MEIIGIELARRVAFLEVPAADPKGKTSLPDAVGAIRGRYSFVKAPQALEEMSFDKGIEFSVGRLGAINIDRLTLFGNGIVVDTRSSTEDCSAVVDDLLNFFRESFQATVTVTRWMTLSNVIFRSELRLGDLHPILRRIAERVDAATTRDFGQAAATELLGITIGPDLSQMKLQPIAFTVERRVDTPFSAKVYFSTAPLQTEEHIQALADFEAALLTV